MAMLLLVQGKSPFPFALAELVDNSLRAVQQARRPHGQITVSLVLNSLSHPTSGLLSVWDNGQGMLTLCISADYLCPLIWTHHPAGFPRLKKTACASYVPSCPVYII